MYCYTVDWKNNGADACDCGCHGGYGRHFMTKEEKKKILADYAEQLKKELEAVEERIKEL